MKSDVCGGKPTDIRPLQNTSLPNRSVASIADAMLAQARHLMELAMILGPEGSIETPASHNFLHDPAPLSGIFFQEDRSIEPDTRELARSAYRIRRLRDTIFSDLDLFGEPAWDILLDLANAKASGVRVSVSSACVGSCVPATTALRWLAILEEKGLIEREDDLLDGRRTYVSLSRKGLYKMVEFLKSAYPAMSG